MSGTPFGRGEPGAAAKSWKSSLDGDLRPQGRSGTTQAFAGQSSHQNMAEEAMKDTRKERVIKRVPAHSIRPRYNPHDDSALSTQHPATVCSAIDECACAHAWLHARPPLCAVAAAMYRRPEQHLSTCPSPGCRSASWDRCCRACLLRTCMQLSAQRNA